MPLGVISQDDLLLELEKLSPSNNIKVPSLEDKDNDNLTPHKNSGRTLGRENLTPETRKAIAELSIVSDMTGKELAEEFRVSQSTVSAIKHGATSTATYHDKDEELNNHINKVKERLREKSRVVLDDCLDTLTVEKISQSKARDIASIAKNMSGIYKDLEDSRNGDNDNKLNVQFIMMAPVMKQEQHYDAIDVQVLDID